MLGVQPLVVNNILDNQFAFLELRWGREDQLLRSVASGTAPHIGQGLLGYVLLRQGGEVPVVQARFRLPLL